MPRARGKSFLPRRLTGMRCAASYAPPHTHEILPPAFGLSRCSPARAWPRWRLDAVKSFADLEKVAAQLALQPYQAPTQQLDPFFEGLKYDGHRQIRYLRDKALFADLGDTFRIEFFHPGWMFKKPVMFYDMKGPQTTVDVPFDRKNFEYGDLKVPADAKNPWATPASACWHRTRW
jgi:hypothetical protein